MSAVELNNVSKRFDGGASVVRRLSLAVREGEFFTILGPSGCGKTTTLRMVAGLDSPTEGEIRIGGTDCTRLHPRDRNIGFVFQGYALYPHMTVFDNIGLNLKIAGVGADEIRARVTEIASILRLDALLGRKPKQLSGGERQRVALGRALVRKPQVLLMDEPLSNLDLKLREHMRTELRRLHQAYRHTVICVTHDQVEAMTMSDRIAVMRDGRVEQVGTPEDVYLHPASVFVASFIGSPSINLLKGVVVPPGKSVSAARKALRIRLSSGVAVEKKGERPVLVGVRPEDVLISSAGKTSGMPAVIALVETLGATKLLFLDLCAQVSPPTRVVAMVPGHQVVQPGQRVSVSVRQGRKIVFDPDSELLVGYA